MKIVRKKLLGLALAGGLALSSVGAGVGAAPAQAWSMGGTNARAG